MKRAYYCFRSILSLSHLFAALLIHKMVLQGCEEDITETKFFRET